MMNAHRIEILGLLIKPDKASHPGKHSHWLLRNSFAFSRRCNSYFFISFLNQKLPFCKEQSLPKYIFFLVFQRVSNGKECGALSLSGSDSILPPAAKEQQHLLSSQASSPCPMIFLPRPLPENKGREISCLLRVSSYRGLKIASHAWYFS